MLVIGLCLYIENIQDSRVLLVCFQSHHFRGQLVVFSTTGFREPIQYIGKNSDFLEDTTYTWFSMFSTNFNPLKLLSYFIEKHMLFNINVKNCQPT